MLHHFVTRLFLLFSFFFVPNGAAGLQELEQEQGQLRATAPSNTRPSEEFNREFSIDITPDGKSLISLSTDRTLGIIRLGDGKVVYSKKLDLEREASCVRVSPDGKLLAIAEFTGQVSVMDLESKETIRSFPGGSYVEFSPDSKTIACEYLSKECRIYEIESCKCLQKLNLIAGTGPIDTGLLNPTIESIRFSSDGKRLAISTFFFDDEVSSEERVQIWDTQTGEIKAFFEGRSAGFSADNSKIAYAIFDSVMQRYRAVVITADDYVTERAFTGGIQLQFAKNQDSIAGLEDGQPDSAGKRIFYYDFETNERSVLSREYSDIQDFVVSPNGATIYSIDRQGGIRIWNLE